MKTNNNKGFKCVDCHRYIVPPQIYDADTIKMCRCDEIKAEISAEPVKPSPVAMEVVACIQRQVALDEARMPFEAAKVPMFVPPPQPLLKPFFKRLAGVFTSLLVV